MNTQTILTLVTILVLSVAPAQLSADNLLLWNRFESEQEVVDGTYWDDTQWGPGFQLRSYIYDDWEEARIEPAMFGNGLFVNHDTNEGWNNDGGNYFAVDLWDVGVTPYQGTFEYWFRFKYGCDAVNHAYFWTSSPELTDHFLGDPPYVGTRFGSTWDGWIGANRKRIYSEFSHSESGPQAQVTTAAGSAGPGGHLAFQTDDLYHFGLVWDIDGIGSSADTMRLYVNGVVEDTTSETWDPTEPFERYLYVGSPPNRDPWDHAHNAVKGVTDNVKVWDYAVTDGFAHRFDENWVPEPGTLWLLGLGALAVLRRRR